MAANLPVLYSFRRCPYAIRARLALIYAGINVELREVQLQNKPVELLELSPKATVPVLQLPDEVLTESLDIMLWALRQHDPEDWLRGDVQKAQDLIARNDGEFKYYLDRYKYPEREPDHPQTYFREQAELFLNALEGCLSVQEYLCAEYFTLADAAILPFIRQFAAVDAEWFIHSKFEQVRNWLDRSLQSSLFAKGLQKYPVWHTGEVGRELLEL